MRKSSREHLKSALHFVHAERGLCKHGELLTVITVVDDPVFLEEPLVRSENWTLDPGQEMGVTYCETANEVPAPVGTVPHHLPGTNTFLTEVADWYGLPREATRGGAATLYPEFRKKMGKPAVKPPEHCDCFCICSMFVDCNLHTPPVR